MLSALLRPSSSAAAVDFVSVCQRQPAIRDTLVIKTGLPCEEITAEHLAKVSRLIFYSEGIEHISATDFQGLSNLEALSLIENHIEKIEPGTFSSLIKLRRLNLEANNIRELNAGAFDGLANLKTLMLPNNELAHIDPQAFRGLNQLLDLSLNNNPLLELDPRLFQEMPLLESIGYSGTLLRRIPMGICAKNSKIHRINLILNARLKEIPDFAFVDCAPGLFIAVDGSPLTQTTKAAFQGVSEVKGLPANFDQDGEGWEQP